MRRSPFSSNRNFTHATTLLINWNSDWNITIDLCQWLRLGRSCMYYEYTSTHIASYQRRTLPTTLRCKASQTLTQEFYLFFFLSRSVSSCQHWLHVRFKLEAEGPIFAKVWGHATVSPHELKLWLPGLSMEKKGRICLQRVKGRHSWIAAWQGRIAQRNHLLREI